MKSWLLGIGLLLTNLTFGQTIKDGLHLIDRHQPSRAKQVFEGLVSAAPTGENYFYLGYYYLTQRDWDNAKQSLAPLVTKLNKIRNANRALQRLRNLHFHHTDNEAIIAYSKRDGDNLVLVIVNLDPSNAQATVVHWNMELLGLTGDSFVVDDQLTGNTFSWTRDSFVSLDPRADFNNVAHLAVVRIP